MGFNLESYREALIAERADYVVKGKTARVAEVDKELARLDGLLSTDIKHLEPSKHPSNEKIAN
jgi:hypothetical protein